MRGFGGCVAVGMRGGGAEKHHSYIHVYIH